MKILIVEDEGPAARRLERLLKDALGARADSVVCAETVEDATQAMNKGRVDLVLLDLDLNGADGFDAIRGGGPPVIVVSARADRAIDAFDHAVVDFVTKPVSPERLQRALDRLSETRDDAGMSLAVRSAGRIDLAPVASILRLSGADDYVEVALADGRTLLHDASLDDLEKRLPASFVRVHRSHIVNLAQVSAARGGDSKRVLVLNGGSEVPVSRRRAADVMAALKRREKA